MIAAIANECFLAVQYDQIKLGRYRHCLAHVIGDRWVLIASSTTSIPGNTASRAGA
jgi:hypothetical protein